LKTIGRPSLVAFSIGDADGTRELREVHIHLVGQTVSAETSAFVPGLLGGLIPKLRYLEHRLNFLEDEKLFSSLPDITAVHNALVHGDMAIFPSEAEHEQIAERCGFLHLGVPETDGFRAFLIPWFGQLYLTQQVSVQLNRGFSRLVTVAGVMVTPFFLISVLRDVVHELQGGV
jgi:hypothetical protein